MSRKIIADNYRKSVSQQKPGKELAAKNLLQDQYNIILNRVNAPLKAFPHCVAESVLSIIPFIIRKRQTASICKAERFANAQHKLV